MVDTRRDARLDYRGRSDLRRIKDASSQGFKRVGATIVF